MKPFNLESAKAGALCITRDGNKAELIHANLKGKRSLVFKITDQEGHEDIFLSYFDGRTWDDSTSQYDIFMAPAKTGAWINIYPLPCHTNRFYSSYPTKEEADKNTTHDRISCFYVEWEE